MVRIDKNNNCRWLKCISTRMRQIKKRRQSGYLKHPQYKYLCIEKGCNSKNKPYQRDNRFCINTYEYKIRQFNINKN